ncbi:MAG TPA: flavodoxin domain-containing protein, partial [Candidatus Saccharimonadales bacterium]|nr:flavodoxin domain-containing protein [Candidatus Saccharimonadales bacterium]
MKVLVAVASKYGGTQEIAYVISKIMSKCGIDTDVKNIETDSDIASYDAIVLGSAVYHGNWLKSARDFVDKHAEELASRPTWLFSSG